MRYSVRKCTACNAREQLPVECSVHAYVVIFHMPAKQVVIEDIRGANRNPKIRNSEIVRISTRYSDGQQLILSEKDSCLVAFPEKGKFNVDLL